MASDATIRYTTDGTTPTSTHGTIYSDPVHIADTTTLKAMAHKSGYNDSAVKSADYFIHTLTITGGPSGTPDPVASGGQVSLNVDASDSLGHGLSYGWSASCPAPGSDGSFDNASAEDPTWTAPDNATGAQQSCTIQVTVDDGAEGLSETSSYSQEVNSVRKSVKAMPWLHLLLEAVSR